MSAYATKIRVPLLRACTAREVGNGAHRNLAVVAAGCSDCPSLFFRVAQRHATGFAAKGGFDHGYIGPIRASDDRTKDLDPGSNLVFLRTSTEGTAFSATFC